LPFAAPQIVFPQDKTQRLNDDKVTAAGVSEDVSPTAGLLDPVAASARNRRAAPGIDYNPLAASKRRGEPTIAIVSRDDFRCRPNFRAKTGE